MPRQRDVMLIILIGSLCLLTRLGVPKLWDRDEPRNARCACEMLEASNWIVPTFNGELRGHKPVLLYWLIMVSFSAFGVSEFSARLPSAVLSVGTLLLTYQIGCRLFDRKTAVWSSVILASTLMFNTAAHAATPDAALIFFCTTAMTFFITGASRGNTLGADAIDRCARLDAHWMAAAGVAIGLGVLAKGPVAYVLPVSCWTVFLWVRRPSAITDELKKSDQNDSSAATPSARPRSIQADLLAWLGPRLKVRHLYNAFSDWRPWIVTMAMLVVAAPWYIAVGVQTNGEWLHEFFVQHNVSRAMQPMEGHQGNAFLFYPVAILIGFFPWSAVTIPAVIWTLGRRQASGYDARFALLIIWCVVWTAAFSLAGTKLPSYVTPIYPALALMAGHFVAHWPSTSAAPARWWPLGSAITLIVVGGSLAAVVPWFAPTYLPGEHWLGLVGVILLIGGVACFDRFYRMRLESGMIQLAITSVCFIVALFGWAAPRVSRHQRIDDLLAEARRLDADAPLASLGVHEPSWVYYARKTIPQLGEANIDATTSLLTQDHGFLISSQEQYERMRPRLPAHASILACVPDFLKDRQLVLIGTSDATTARRRATTVR